ncbi:hypothetical protein Pse7367_2888 [Thalassoporum mexicanum PCC 7367]|uniref:hypothetical protein n=1 Tax=Thalassoporum mexicanum TaxID=3457544 RepID=UPI00029FB4CC|nr:hypothetical protein [Pseudanabaena sp. PCC 7367]AFY71141.1 hypothetical protein Pse7367_2888 [Pseudanabaena sp. PCC 7367]
MADYQVDRSEQQQQSGAKPPFPAEIAQIVAEISELFELYQAKGNQDILLNALTSYLAELRNEEVMRSPEPKVEVEQDDFLKSWQDIIDLQVYVDSDIYGKLDPNYTPAQGTGKRPVVQLSEIEAELQTIAHDDATAAYVKSWGEIADRLTSLPDDLFTRAWSTKELAKFLGCSAAKLRRARKNEQLPLAIGDFVVDCTAATKNKLTWSVRPK